MHEDGELDSATLWARHFRTIQATVFPNVRSFLAGGTIFRVKEKMATGLEFMIMLFRTRDCGRNTMVFAIFTMVFAASKAGIKDANC